MPPKKRKHNIITIKIKDKNTVAKAPASLYVRIVSPAPAHKLWLLNLFSSQLQNFRFKSYFFGLFPTKDFRDSVFFKVFVAEFWHLKNTARTNIKSIALVSSLFIFSLTLTTGNSFISTYQIHQRDYRTIKDVVIKQLSPAVINQPTQYTVLVKQSLITKGKKGQYLVKLPKGATNISVKTILADQAKQILSKETPKITSLFSNLKNPLSFTKPSHSVSVKPKNGQFLLASLDESGLPETPPALEPVAVESLPVELPPAAEHAADPVKTQEESAVSESAPIQEEPVTSDVRVIKTKDATFVDVSSQAPPAPESVTENNSEASDAPVVPDAPAANDANQDSTNQDIADSPEIVSGEVPASDKSSADKPADKENKENSGQNNPDNKLKKEEYIKIDYQIQAAVITEQKTNHGKNVTVSAPNEDPEHPLTNVLAFTAIPEIFNIGQEDNIQIKWTNNQDQPMPFTAHDTNGNGKLDYLEWVVPHLSEQEFNIIYISKAFLLDQDKNVLEDIYPIVKEQDGTFQAVTQGQYVRVTFIKNLTQNNDITLYARPTDPNQPVTIKVYSALTDQLITTFDVIDHEDTYRVLLTNLEQDTDVFDLKITNANADIDFIVDPGNACATNTTGTVNWSAAGTWTSCGGGYPGQSGNSDTVTIANAAVAVTGDVTVTVDTITFTGGNASASINISNGITITATGAATINAPTSASITKEIAVGGGALSVGGLFTLASGSSSTRISKLSVGTGTATLSAGLTCTGSAETFTVASGGTFNFTGTMSAGCLTVTINSGSTTNFSGTVQLDGAYTFGIVTVNSGTTTMGAVAITFAGTTTLGGGTLAVSSATGTKTFTGAVTCTTGSFDLSAAAAVTSFAAGITANCTTFNTGSGTATLSATQSLAGSTNITFGGALTVSAGTTTNNNSGTVLSTGVLTLTGNWAQGANSTLSMNSTNSGSGTLDASTNTPNTVKYNATATLKAPTSSYHNLTITAGTVTSVAVTISNDLVVSGGTFSGTASITVNGGDVTGDGTITMTGGTFLLDGTGNFGGATAWTFNNLTFGDGSGTTTTTATGAGGITVTGATTVAANQTLDAGSKTWNLTGSVSTITFRAEAQDINTGTNCNPGEPAGTVANDLLVGMVWVGSAAGTTPSMPTGWTSLYSGISSNNDWRYNVGYIVRGSSAAATTFTNTNHYRECFIIGFSGVSTTGTIDAQSSSGTLSNASAHNPDPPAVTAVSSAAMAIALGWNEAGNAGPGTTNWTAPTNYTMRSTDPSNGNGVAIASRLLTSSGSENPSAFGNVGSGTTDYWDGATFTLTPATLTPLTVNGTFTASTSTVAFQNDMALTIPALTYYNLTLTPTITAARTYTFAGATTVSNNLDINPTASSALALTANLGGTTTVTGSITIEGTTSGTSKLDTVSGSNYSLTAASINITSAGTFTPQASTVTLTGTSGTLFTKAGTFTVATSTFVVTSSSGQPSLLSAATTFHILKINTTGGSTVINANQTITIDDASGAKLWIAGGVLNDSGYGISTSASTTNTLQIDSGTTLCLGGASTNTSTTCDSNATSTTSRTLPTFQTYTLDSASTVIYLSNAATTVTSKTYGNLSLMPKMTTGVGSLTYTMPSSTVSIAGNFNIKPTASNASLALTVNLATASNTVTGTTTIQPDSTNSPTAKLASTSSNYNLTTGKVDIESNGTLDINNSTLTVTGTSGTLFTRVGTFTIGGTSTTTFSGNGDATLNSGTITFDAMTSSGTGTKTLGNDITTGGALTISAGTLQLSTLSLTANSTTSLTGTLNDNSATGTNLFVGAVTINSGGVWTETNNPAFEFRGGLTENSSSGFTSGTGTYTFSTNAQTISGSQSFTITNLTNSVTSSTGLTFSGAQPTVTTLTQGSSAQLTFSGTVPTITTLTATASSNTVSYTSTSSQTTVAATYVNFIKSGAGGTATLGGNTTLNGTLTISSGTLQLSTANLSVTGASSITGTLNDNSATGTNTFTGAVTINSGGVWTETNNPGFTFQGGLTNDSSSGFTSGTGTYTFDTNAQTISGSQSFTITNLTNNVTSSTGLTFSGAQPTVTTLTQGSSAQLTFSGTVPTITTLTATASSNTVSYTSTSSQTTIAATYVNFVKSGSGGTATLGGDTVLNGTLTISSGSLQLSTASFTATGASSITGTLNDNSATGTNIFIGAVTINSGGVWTETNNPAFEFRGGLTNDSSSGFTSGTGTYTFSTNAQTISGSQSFTITNLTNSVTSSTGLTFSGAQPTVTTLTQGSSAYLTFSGNTVPTITTLTATASGNTVEYSAASQAIKVVSYVNLTLSGSGTATGAVTTVTGALNISGTVSWSADAITSTMTSVTVNTTGTLTLGANMATSGALTVTKGTFSASGSNYTVTAASVSSANTNTRTITMGSGLWTLNGTGTVWDTSTTTNLTLTSSGTIKITDTSSTANTFSGGGVTSFNNIYFSRGSSTASNTIAGSNTFADFKDDGSAAHSILFTTGTTQTVTTFTVSGTSGNLITINSTTTGTHTLSKASGTVFSDYLSVQHSIATGGASWYAGSHSTDNNSVTTAGSGWIFANAPCTSLATGNWNTAGTWDCGHVPTTSDPVIVAASHVVTMDVNSASLGTITINGTLNTSDGTSRSLSGTTLAIGAVGTLTANASVITLSGTSGTLFAITSGGTFTNGTSEVVITSAADLTLNSTATSFYKLTFNNSGNTTTLGAATTVDNNLTITAGTLQLSTLGLTVTGTTSLTGTLNDNSATGTNLFVGAVTINSGGVWTETNNPAFEFRGGLTENSSSGFTSGTGTYTFSTNAQTISGSQSFTITNLTNSVTSSTGLTFSGAQPTVTTLTQGSSAQLTFSGSMPTITTLTATASGNTVSYTSTGSQTVKGTTYVNLTIDKSGQTATLGGDTTANNNVTITAGTLDADNTNNYNLTVGGTWSNSGTFTPRQGTFTLTGTSTFSDTTSFYNFAINGSGKTVTLGGALTASNNLTITAGTLDVSASGCSSASCAVSVGGTWSNSGTFTARTGTVTLTGTSTFSDTTSFYNLTINGSGKTVTLGGALTASNNLTITAGILDVSASGCSSASCAVSVGGNWSNSGTFTARSGTVTLTSTSSSATLDSGGSSFYNLTQNGTGGTYTLQGGLGTSNNLTITAGTLDTKSTFNYGVSVGGTWSRSGTFTVRNANFTLTGTSTFSDTMSFYNFIINASGNTVTLGAALTATNNLTITAGTLDVSASGCSSASCAVSVGGNWSNSGTFTKRTGTVTLTSTSSGATLTSGGSSFYNLTQNGTGGTYTLQDALSATNNLTITAGTLDTKASSNYGVTVGGTWSNSGTFTPQQGTVTLTGTSTFSDTTSFYNITINASGNTVTLGGALTATNNLTITAGTLDASASGCSSASCAISVGANFSNSGTFTARTGTVTITSTSSGATLTSGGSSFYNLTQNGSGGTYTLQDALATTNNLTITNGTLDVSASNCSSASCSVSVGGNFSNAGTFTARSGTVTLTSTSGSATLSPGGTSFYNLTQNGSGGTYTLQGGLGVTNNLTITARTLDTKASSNYGVTVGGTWSRSGTFTVRQSNFTLTGNNTFADTMSFYNFIINGSGKTTTLGAALTASNNLTITAGTLDVSASGCSSASCSVTVAGNFSNSGTFTARTGTVTLNGTSQKVFGSTTFYNFTKNIASASADTLMFENTKTQTGASGGTFSLVGASGKVLTLRSMDSSGTQSDGTEWNLTVNGSQNVTYVDVKDSNASGGTAIAQTNSTNSGNNTNWTFNTAPTFSSISNTSGYIKSGGTVTFTTTASDPDSGDTVTLYVCKANDFTGSACGSGGTWCSSSASTTNPSCSYTVQSSDTDGSHTYYGNIIDNNSSQSSSNPRSGTFTTDSTAPTVDAGTDQSKSASFTQDATVSDATSGIASYQWSKQSGGGTITFGTDTAEDTTISASAAGTYVIRLTATDNAGNSNYDEFTLTWTVTSSSSGGSGGGGGSHFSALDKPQGNFSLTINNGSSITASQDVTLNMIGVGSDVKSMSVSNDQNFAGAIQEAYQTTKSWRLTDGEGLKTVYVKFFTAYGVASDVITSTINYTTQPQNPISQIIDQIGQGVTEIKDNIGKIFTLKPPAPPALPPVEETVKKAAPLSLKGKWNLLAFDSIWEFLFAPLPTETKSLAKKLPEVNELFKQTGIVTVNSTVQKLQGVELTVPGLNKRTIVQKIGGGGTIPKAEPIEGGNLTAPKLQGGGLAKTELAPVQFALPKNIPLAQIGANIKKVIPTEIVFARTANELIDFNIILSINDQGKLQQRINTISGQEIKLAVKPDGPVSSVKGYLVLKSKQPAPTAFELPRNIFSASLLFSNPDLVASSQGAPKVETQLLLDEFDYQDEDKDGIWTANIKAPAVDGEYEVTTIMKYKDIKVGDKEIRLVVVVDPEGYVYSSVMGGELRINGAIVSLYWLNPESKQYEIWPAADFQQENPQITNKTGKYAFLVPEGLYYIEVAAPNYATFQSEVLTVKQGNGIHMNIELKSKNWWLAYFDWKTILLALIFLLLCYLIIRGKIRK